LEYDWITTDSCRQTAERLNRIRLQEDGAKATTVRNQSEREGFAIYEAMRARAETTFVANGFDDSGHKRPDTEVDFSKAELKTAEATAVTTAAEELGVMADAGGYEAVGQAIYISIDEVCCKKQSAERPHVENKEVPKQVRNTVIHIQKGAKQYIVAGETVASAMMLLMGFLLSNGLIGPYPLVFFADGAKVIKNAIEDYFGFASYRLILDWPHLTKKTAELLSSSIKGRDKRNEIHGLVKTFLWRGDVSAAIALLDELSSEWVKSIYWLNQLKGYLERNRACIPCYALRAKLGLRNSSNRGEKANDRVVSRRQKHSGMAWSKEGSYGLASICVACINGEMSGWLHRQVVRFAFCDEQAA
jgi:hypothetical protein